MSKPWIGAARPLPPQAMEDAARAIGCDTAAIRAVWSVEAAGQHYLSDGTVIRRFEPHHMPGSTLDWRDSLAISTRRRNDMFEKAYSDHPDAALRATSWGAAQIMGFNAKAAGYDNADQMVRDMAQTAQAQLDAFVSLAKTWGIDGAIRAQDWDAFARRWNGSGQVPVYSRKMESAYRRFSGGARSPQVLRVGARGAAVKKLQKALGVPVDGAFGPNTKTAVEDFQREENLPIDGIVGQVTWTALESARNAKPAVQETQGDKLTKQVAKVSAAVGTISTAAASVRDVVPPIPDQALPTIYIVGAVALALAGLLYAWKVLR